MRPISDARREGRILTGGGGRAALRVLAFAYLATAGLVAFVALAARATGEPVRAFLIDPAAELEVAPYYGFASNIGVLVWWGAAVACGGAAALLWHTRRPGSHPLLILATTSAAAALDDLFMVHEYFFPALGVAQEAVLAAYLVATLALLWTIRGFIAANDGSMLAVAGAFFAVSLVVDSALGPSGAAYMLEDGSKLFGISTWATFLVRASWRAVVASPSPPAAMLPRSSVNS